MVKGVGPGRTGGGVAIDQLNLECRLGQPHEAEAVVRRGADVRELSTGDVRACTRHPRESNPNTTLRTLCSEERLEAPPAATAQKYALSV